MIAEHKADCCGSSPSYEVARAAKARLRANPWPRVREVSCECNDQGVLFLRGRLGSFYQKQLAQEAVAGLSGVTLVINETEVAA